MTKREELICMIARVIYTRRYGSSLPSQIGPNAQSECMDLADDILDAILAGLDDPSEEMVAAGHDHIAGDGDLETLFRAMLKPLKGE